MTTQKHDNMQSPISSYSLPLSFFAQELEKRQSKIPPLSYRDCENFLARHYGNSSPQMITRCRRELARTCRNVRRYEGKEAAKNVLHALSRYVWSPFERLREERFANRAAATRRRIKRMRTEGKL